MDSVNRNHFSPAAQPTTREVPPPLDGQPYTRHRRTLSSSLERRALVGHEVRNSIRVGGLHPPSDSRRHPHRAAIRAALNMGFQVGSHGTQSRCSGPGPKARSDTRSQDQSIERCTSSTPSPDTAQPSPLVIHKVGPPSWTIPIHRTIWDGSNGKWIRNRVRADRQAEDQIHWVGAVTRSPAFIWYRKTYRLPTAPGRSKRRESSASGSSRSTAYTVMPMLPVSRFLCSTSTKGSDV